MSILYYLASNSPRRQELAKIFGLPFTVLAPNIDESKIVGESAGDYVQRMSEFKAINVLELIEKEGLSEKPVLAADTIVVLDKEILGKPASTAEAKDMLNKLSGRTHEVLTHVTLGSKEVIRSVLCRNSVTFTALDDLDIDRYIAKEEFVDKAGGYGLQGFAACFVSHLSGSYSGVVGLPLFETARLFKESGLLPR